jgi:hypothetical protein
MAITLDTAQAMNLHARARERHRRADDGKYRAVWPPSTEELIKQVLESDWTRQVQARQVASARRLVRKSIGSPESPFSSRRSPAMLSTSKGELMSMATSMSVMPGVGSPLRLSPVTNLEPMYLAGQQDRRGAHHVRQRQPHAADRPRLTGHPGRRPPHSRGGRRLRSRGPLCAVAEESPVVLR